MALSSEERRERASLAVKRWAAANKERVKEYKREYARRPEVAEASNTRRRTERARLQDLGLLPKKPLGRPRLYATVEEAKEAKRKQQKQCLASYRQRYAEAREALRELDAQYHEEDEFIAA